jgi:3-hydroxybutyryl-CoA dehydratase
MSFARLTGDFNPRHLNPHQNIVHGMLVGSLFSTLVGMYCPGQNCLYLSQEIEFIKPIHPNQKIIIKGTVTNKIKALKILWLKTEVLVDGKAAIKGQAKVKVLEP